MKKQLQISRMALKLVFIMSLLIGWNATAQTYPVQAHITTTGPYLNYLSYYGDHNNHLQITLTNLDFNSPTLLVRLRIHIEGSGWELYTNPNATIGQPFALDPGMPLTISGIELLPYLQANNLINPNGVDLNNLPKGFANICVDVINESAQQQVLSTNNCGFLPIQEYQPPQAFVPNCGEQLDTNAMFHNFTWSPPVPFPAGADIEVRYDFAIHRWVDPNNNAALGGNSILVYEETDLFATTTQVSDFHVQWEMGGTYIWTVTARVISNGIPLNLIENNGVSAPCTFVYGEELSLADQLADGLEIILTAEQLAERKGIASWTVNDDTPNQGLSDFDEFVLEYRKQPTGNEGYEIPWFSKTLTDTSDFIYQLEPSTTYEVKVSGVIAGVVGDPTPVKTFTTPDPRIYNCGESDLPFLPNTYTVLENATVGTQVQIGQFIMTMTEVNELGGGHYAGRGTIPIAFLGGAKAKVRFDDILIDTEYRVHEGRVDVITKGLENWLDEQYQQFIDPYYVDGTIDSAWVDTTAGVAWVTVNGVDTSFTFNPPHYPIIVNDENGNQYTIYPNGTIIVTSYLAISETWAVMPDEVIHFTQNDAETRGFDGKEHMQWHENYEIMQLADSSKYFVANKSLAKGEGDKVNVEIPEGVNASFQLSDGTNVPATALQGNWIGTTEHTNSTQMTLNIPARNNAGNYEVFAYVNNQKVGQLNVKVYSQKDKELIVVPIASTNLTKAQIEAELDNTLGEANIDVDVTIDSVWVDTAGIFTASTNISLPDEVGMLTKYSQDMRDLRDAYFEQHPNAPKNKYYVFLVNGFDEPNEMGYMVRGRSMGFVKASQQNVLQTISHELGHGMGALAHSWKDNGPDQGTTSNLMDYEENPNQQPKDNLTKAQWKELRDFDVVPSLWDEVEDGSAIGPLSEVWISMESQFRNPTDSTMCFLSPNNKVVKLPKNTVQFYLSNGNDDHYNAPLMLATGVLLSFSEVVQLNTGEFKIRKYSADIANGQFSGYNASSDENITTRTTDQIQNFFGTIDSEFTADPNFYVGEVYDKYKSEDASSDFGVIGFKNHLHQFCVYKFETSPYDYIEDYSQAFGPTFEIKGIDEDLCVIKGAEMTFIENRALTGTHNPVYDILHLATQHGVNEEVLIISKICELRSKYPDIYDKMSTTAFNHWDSTNNWASQFWIDMVNAIDVNYNQISSLGGEEDLIKAFYKNAVSSNNQFFDQYYYNYDLHLKPKKEVWMHFLNCYNSLISSYQLIFADDLQAVNNLCDTSNPGTTASLSADRVVMLTELMSNDEISGLCVEGKLKLIEKLLEPTSWANPFGIVWDKYEVAILKLLLNTNTADCDTLLNGLCTTVSGGELLIQRMVDGIDDETCWMGSNNFTVLLNWIIKTYNHFTNHDLQVFLGNSATPTNAQIELLQKRTITYNYTGFVKRLFTSPIGNTGDMMTEVYIGSDNKVKVKNYLEAHFFNVGSAPVRSLNPLDPVVIVDDSKLVDLYAGNGSREGGFIAPAIVLYFLESKAEARTTQSVIQTVADVASLLIPGAGAYKLITYADKLSSVMSIAGSYYQDDNPELASYLNLTSSILGLGSMTVDLTNINSFRTINTTEGAISKLNQNGTNFNQYMNMNQSDNVLALKNRIDRAISSPSNLTNAEALQRLDDISVLNGEKSKALLITTIENEISVAKAGGNTQDVINLEYTLSKVKNYGYALDYNYHNFYKALESNAGNWTGNTFYRNSSKNTVVARVEPEGLVIHQATDPVQIPDNATLIAVVENTDYRLLEQNNFTNNADIFIYEDGGNMKVFCLGSGNCFTENTDISTIHGMKKIADIAVGDSVLSYDEGTQLSRYARVKKLFKKHTTSLVRLVADADTLWATPDHRFLTKKGWETARNLAVGVSLITANGTLALDDVQLKDSISEVYNFEVEATHTYTVGEQQLVVHNDCQSTINALLYSKKLDPDDIAAFENDFKNLPDLLNKFESTELSVDAWRVLSEMGSTLRTDESVLSFLRSLDNKPNLRTKFLNDFDDPAKTAFTSDFAANQIMLGKFEDGTLSTFAWQGLQSSAFLRNDLNWLTRTTDWINAGGEMTVSGGNIILNKSGQGILEIKNDKILPILYDYPVTSAIPVGSPSNGYQVVSSGGNLSVRRVPNMNGYSPEELTLLTQHPEAHILERHGPDVTDDALIKRSTGSVVSGNLSHAPDGELGNIPSYSSKFMDEQSVKEALENVKVGSPAFQAKEQVFGANNIRWKVEIPGNYGYGYPSGSGGSAPMNKVIAIYEEVSPGSYQLITMYPTL